MAGQTLPSEAILTQFSANGSECSLKQSGNGVILTQDESWMDARLDEALTEARLARPKVRVDFIEESHLPHKLLSVI
jgi:hypothetical protein